MAHLVKDKLAKTVSKLQMRLQEVDHILKLKVATYDIALNA